MGGVGAVDIRGWGGGQNRESPDFRSPEVGRYAQCSHPSHVKVWPFARQWNYFHF